MPKVQEQLEDGNRVQRLILFLEKVQSIPPEWLEEPISDGEEQLKPVACTSYAVLVEAWQKAMKWTEGLDAGLCVMLASNLSTMVVGDQLWVKVLGPASCGKSTLCEALSVNKQYVIAKSTIRGFHSGYTTGGDSEDHSLISKINGKSLVTKDGDTIMSSPNVGQILSEGRDVYDTVSRSDYRNGQGKDYEGFRTTWILCGTNALRKLDTSELGARFLDCVIMEEIDDEMEDDILAMVAARANENAEMGVKEDATTQQDPALTFAMQLTAGYVSHLRDNDVDILSSVKMDDQSLHKCTRYGKFVAFLRARPSMHNSENDEREFAARLVSQLTRLAKCVAGVLNKNKVDTEVLKRVRKVCIDTAGGVTYNIAHYLYHSENGMESKGIAIRADLDEREAKRMMRFLVKIGIAEHPVTKQNKKNSQRYILTERMRLLWEEVVI